jgi:hypothetical protein
MRLAVAIAVLAAPFVAGCEEEYEPARNPTQEVVAPQQYMYGRGVAVPQQVIYVQQPPPDRRPPETRRSDPQWQVETYYVPPPSADYYIPPPHPIPRHTISLGYIGDWPLGPGDPPPEPWWRPFPPAWEHDFHYGHGYTLPGARYRWR